MIDNVLSQAVVEAIEVAAAAVVVEEAAVPAVSKAERE
jgi:hypothetical protein